MDEHSAEIDTPSVRRRWRVVDAEGKELGVWIERFNTNPRHDEAWALDCAATYYPGHEVQVQTTTVSDWTRVTSPAEGSGFCSECGMADGPYPNGDRPPTGPLASGCPRCGWCY